MHVLFIDDDPLVARAFSRLAAMLGHTVRHVATSEEADEVLRSARVNAVVADFDLVGESGADYLQRVAEEWPHLQRVLVSGSPPPAGFRVRAPLQLFLHKPFGRDDVARLFDELLAPVE